MNKITCGKREIPIVRCPNHSHLHWEIILHLTGFAKAIVDNKEYSLSPGTVMVIPPNIFHFNFSSDSYTDVFLSAENLDFSGVVVAQDTDNTILTLMNMLFKTYIEKEYHYLDIMNALTETICTYIKKFSHVHYNHSFVNDLKNLIYNNISNKNFDLAKEIDKSGYNPDYARRCFKKELCKTPLEYLTTLRLTMAKTLLIHENFTTIENVAYSCGFNDSYYFSTCFKKHVGIPPLQYRKKHLLK